MKAMWDAKVEFNKARGDLESQWRYISKNGTQEMHSFGKCKPPKPLKLIEVLRPWQQTLLDFALEEPDDRTIHWVYEEIGNVDKSAFCKLLCASYGALICAGKTADMKFQIAKAEVKPEIIIMDIPRSNVEYVSYTGIEEIKNGCFSSQKYESGMVIMNCPHVFIFANTPPNRAAMSADRWKVWLINEGQGLSPIVAEED